MSIRSIIGRGLRGLIMLAIAGGLAVVIVGGFLSNRGDTNAGDDAPVKPPEHVTKSADGSALITAGEAVREHNGIATESLVPRPQPVLLRAYGTVLDPGGLTALVGTFVTDRAERDAAQAKRAMSNAAFARAQMLAKDAHNFSEAQVQAAEAAFRADDAALAAANARLQTLNATAAQQWGDVLARDLADGAPAIARLIAGQDRLIEVTLPADTALPHPTPKTARMQVGEGAPDHTVPLTLISPAPRADPRMQGISLFYLAHAADTDVVPGMNVVAYVPTGAVVDAVTVPPSAVVWWAGHAWVYLRTGPDSFARRAIDTDTPTPDGGYVVSDLSTGAHGPIRLATEGAQALLSEEFRAEIEVGEENKE